MTAASFRRWRSRRSLGAFQQHASTTSSSFRSFVKTRSDGLDRISEVSCNDRRGGAMSLDELREAAILGRVVERVAERQSFCGETLLQKSAYFLKELLGVPLSTPFRIYYYG